MVSAIPSVHLLALLLQACFRQGCDGVVIVWVVFLVHVSLPRMLVSIKQVTATQPHLQKLDQMRRLCIVQAMVRDIRCASTIALLPITVSGADDLPTHEATLVLLLGEPSTEPFKHFADATSISIICLSLRLEQQIISIISQRRCRWRRQRKRRNVGVRIIRHAINKPAIVQETPVIIRSVIIVVTAAI
jgi:hypothetical protein